LTALARISTPSSIRVLASEPNLTSLAAMFQSSFYLNSVNRSAGDLFNHAHDV
jgi:hypothetical protein